MVTAACYSTSVNDDDRQALINATRAVNQAPPRQRGRKGEARDLARTRANLIRDLAHRYRGNRYPNRWNPIITEIVEITGLSRTQVSRIVNSTPVVRGTWTRKPKQ
jgi:hypothetical protein